MAFHPDGVEIRPDGSRHREHGAGVQPLEADDVRVCTGTIRSAILLQEQVLAASERGWQRQGDDLRRARRGGGAATGIPGRRCSGLLSGRSVHLRRTSHGSSRCRRTQPDRNSVLYRGVLEYLWILGCAPSTLPSPSGYTSTRRFENTGPRSSSDGRRLADRQDGFPREARDRLRDQRESGIENLGGLPDGRGRSRSAPDRQRAGAVHRELGHPAEAIHVRHRRNDPGLRQAVRVLLADPGDTHLGAHARCPGGRESEHIQWRAHHLPSLRRCLHLRASAPFYVPNPNQLLNFYGSIAEEPGVDYLPLSHATIAPAVVNPGLVRDLSKVLLAKSALQNRNSTHPDKRFLAPLIGIEIRFAAPGSAHHVGQGTPVRHPRLAGNRRRRHEHPQRQQLVSGIYLHRRLAQRDRRRHQAVARAPASAEEQQGPVRAVDLHAAGGHPHGLGGMR